MTKDEAEKLKEAMKIGLFDSKSYPPYGGMIDFIMDSCRLYLGVLFTG